ncbi:MAG: efflux RND transporter periplasmic adaptor subunit [Gammaproteobacteria bacterium]|nr:efflux RND transporter periplasmic adaptor subunit [Gammaproteobacteria bacterium]
MITRNIVELVLLISALASAGCQRQVAEAELGPQASVAGATVIFAKNPVGLRTAAVEAAGQDALSLPGRLAWDEDLTVRIFSPFAGRVVRTLVQPGDSVQVGQPLVELASADFGQAQADAAKAAADLSLAEHGARRAEALSRVGVVAQKDVQQAEADYRRAQVEQERAQTRLRQVDAGSGRNFVLKAPIAGVVVDKAVNPGQELRADQTGAPLFLITDPSHLWVWLDAPETVIARLPSAASVPAFVLTTAAYPGATFPGHVVHTAEFIDPVSRTFKLRGAIDNPQRRLKAEMFVSVTLASADTNPPAMLQTVPATAVYLDNGHRYAFVRDSERQFSRVEVQVVREQIDRLTITGIAAAAEVVVEGTLYLQQFLDKAQMAPSLPQSTAEAISPGAVARS